jgi:beta-galactosidase
MHLALLAALLLGCSDPRDASQHLAATPSVRIDRGTSGNDPLHTDVYDGHRAQSFNAGWRFLLGDAAEYSESGFDDAAWRLLEVPHDYSIETTPREDSRAGRGGGYLDAGTAWYRKSFTLPQADGQRTFIHFDGVYMDSSVWLNGKLLGNRPYGYSTFGFDLTEHLKYGDTPNVLAVRVNHQLPSSRWYSGSGIYRNVWLTRLPPVHVAEYGVSVHFGRFTRGTVTPELPSSATAWIQVQLENQSNSTEHAQVVTTLRDREGKPVAIDRTEPFVMGANLQHELTRSLEIAAPHLWSPEDPYLYELEACVVMAGNTVDCFRTTTGIRYLHFDPNRGLFLNGKSLRIFGAGLHHELGALGAAFNYRAVERRINLLRSMGVNAIRTAHNPPAPELLELCDRSGLLVMDEIFDCWETGKSTYDYARFFTQWAERDTREWVRRDRNHPSVVFWSAGNEIPNPSVETAANLKRWIQEEDPSRPVTWARDVMEHEPYQTITDQVFDLAGYNYPSTALRDSLHEKYPNWIAFGSETMSGRMSRGMYVFPAEQRNFKTSPDWGSSFDNCTSRTAMGHDAAYQTYVDRPYLLGEFTWLGVDHLGENEWPLKSYTAGKIDSAGFPKEAYYIYRSRRIQEPMVHLLPHWNWAPGGKYFYTDPNPGADYVPLLEASIPVGFTVPVTAYSNVDEVELFVNGTSHGTQHCGATSTAPCRWEVAWEPGTLRAVGRRAGVEVATDQVTTAGPAAKIALTVDRHAFTSDPDDRVFVTAEVQDSEGVPVPDAGNLVQFAVDGPGAIVAVDNGDPSDTDEPYIATRRRAYAGKCLAILRANGVGKLTITATSENLAAGTLTVASQGR